MSNGHVYPEVDGTHIDSSYAEHKYLYRNLRDGQFEEVTDRSGSGITASVPARGCAFGDYDNDGDMDVVVNCVNASPQLLRCDRTADAKNTNFLKVRLVGTKSNRSGIGARLTVSAQTGTQFDPASKAVLKQIDEVRSGGSYFSQNDPRVHFGLGAAGEADLEVQWPSGTRDVLKGLPANKLYVIQEGGKIVRTVPMAGKPA